eukprot:PhM_4_TR15910/c0_g1_i1/m.21299
MASLQAGEFTTYFLTPLMISIVGVNAYIFSKKSSSKTGTEQQQKDNASFRSFQIRFVAVYLLMMAADWLQGPYVYKLYDFYGYSRHDNGVLFIAGFGSSMIFGTWAGPIADRYGRKLACVMYGVAYILSCATKHFNNYSVLMLGRILGGFATSILWSAFESWMVSEHNARGFDPDLVGSTFSWMITGNGFVAIASGLVAQVAVDAVQHPVAPFDVAIGVLVLSTVAVWFSWSENYGNANTHVFAGAWRSVEIMMSQKKILYLGLCQSFFEGAMYTFVFMWTPALQTANGDVTIPHGTIFACFMLSCSLGATLYSVLESNGVRHVTMLKGLFAASCAMMGLVCLNDQSPFLITLEFCLFEVGVGVFWPALGTLRSKHIPEAERATIMNLFRVPLNFIVCCVLYFQGSMHFSTVFVVCTAFHLVCVVLAGLFDLELKREVAASKDAEALAEVTSNGAAHGHGERAQLVHASD